MTITASMIKELRERTGIGMTKCKAALEEAGGDMTLAIENLRKAGAASAVKKEGRETKEGLIGIAQAPNASAIVEINSETDFVAKNDKFRQFLTDVANAAANNQPADLDTFLIQPFGDSGMTVEEARAQMVQTIGENIKISRIKVFPKTADNSVGLYQHLGGRIVVAVELNGTGEEKLASDIAMHAAASAPEYLNREEIPAEIIEKEKEIGRAQVAGKPENIIDKILEGKIRAFCDQICLANQKFVRDESVTIEELIANKAKESGKELSLKAFTRWDIGK